MKSFEIIGEPAYEHLGEFYDDKFTDEGDYNENPVTITRYESNDELEIVVMGLSDGTWWFIDNNFNSRIKHYVDPYNVKWDDNYGWKYRSNGRNLPWVEE